MRYGSVTPKVTIKPAAPKMIASEQKRFTQYPIDGMITGATPALLNGILFLYGSL